MYKRQAVRGHAGLIQRNAFGREVVLRYIAVLVHTAAVGQLGGAVGIGDGAASAQHDVAIVVHIATASFAPVVLAHGDGGIALLHLGATGQRDSLIIVLC